MLQYDFSARHDIVRFIKEIQAQGLYVTLRIGPFIEGEWTYGLDLFITLSPNQNQHLLSSTHYNASFNLLQRFASLVT